MNILLTGGASGIGRAIALSLLKTHHITLLDKNPPSFAGTNFIPINLSSIEKVEDMLSEWAETHTFDVLLNIAGIREIISPHDLTREKWDEVFKVNVTAPFLLSQHLIKQALKNKKPLCIINIASVSGLLAEPNRAAYVASKHALIGLTKQLGFQYGRERIRVNAIAPGIIETEMTQSYFKDPETLTTLLHNTPTGVWGQCEDLLSLVDVCMENPYLNGAVLVCDGGWSCGKTL